MADFTARLTAFSPKGQVPVPHNVWKNIANLKETTAVARYLDYPSDDLSDGEGVLNDWIMQAGPLLQKSGIAVREGAGYLANASKWVNTIMHGRAGTDEFCFSDGSTFVLETQLHEQFLRLLNAPSTLKSTTSQSYTEPETEWSSTVNSTTSQSYEEQNKTDWSNSVLDSPSFVETGDIESSHFFTIGVQCTILMLLVGILVGAARQVIGKKKVSDDTKPLMNE
eukprot:Protomagalhaensia_wolfi_Nauph_80__239@NODE_1134_length_1706_cov_5_697061_g519_i1_p1_GENE_NODE_1134_length_1706_cov_5_697061_g519_i1NODE_1134_length_1706_cov_5_697061_g519_i1_p1_ORF_typecomplete_len224_score11_44KCT2/PF17818_1/0_0074TMEM154/PF15102_6/0_029_NODE_1134_length_1706_cov_5_697061_g519_i1253924